MLNQRVSCLGTGRASRPRDFNSRGGCIVNLAKHLSVSLIALVGRCGVGRRVLPKPLPPVLATQRDRAGSGDERQLSAGCSQHTRYAGQFSASLRHRRRRWRSSGGSASSFRARGRRRHRYTLIRPRRSLDATAYQNLQRLYDSLLSQPRPGRFLQRLAQTTFGLFATADLAAAFQLAVWEIVFDSNARRFRASNRGKSASPRPAWSCTIRRRRRSWPI